MGRECERSDHHDPSCHPPEEIARVYRLRSVHNYLFTFFYLSHLTKGASLVYNDNILKETTELNTMSNSTAYQIWLSISDELSRAHSIRQSLASELQQMNNEQPPAFQVDLQNMRDQIEHQRGIIDGLYAAQRIAYLNCIREGSIDHA